MPSGKVLNSSTVHTYDAYTNISESAAHQWTVGYKYDPATKMMLGGYSQDGLNFTHTFTVHEVDKKDVMFAIALCGLLYGKNREVVTSYSELVGEEDFNKRMIRYDVELHNCV